MAEIPGIYWIRILYCYPEEITEELIAAIKAEDKVCKYLDIPIQHASDNVLGRMGRKTSRADLERIIGRLRAEIPEICLTHHADYRIPRGNGRGSRRKPGGLWKKSALTDWACSAYSQEEDTPAAEMEDQIAEEIERRTTETTSWSLQQEIAFEKEESLVGSVLTVMIRRESGGRGRLRGTDL